MKYQHRASDSLTETPFAELYRQYAPMIFTYLCRHITVIQDAEDVLLEVFLAALENETLIDMSAERQKAWLLRVAHNKKVDHFRSAAYRKGLPLENVKEHSGSLDEPEHMTLRKEEQEQLYQNIKRLPTVQQDIIYMRYINGLPYNEIARVTNKREATVRVLLSRALALLRTKYTHPEG